MDEHRNPYESIEMLEALGLPVSTEQIIEAHEAETEYIRNDLVPEIKKAVEQILGSVHQSVCFTVKYQPGKGVEVEQDSHAHQDNDILLLRKAVDKSVIYQGFTIPVKQHEAFLARVDSKVEHGQAVEVKVLFGGCEYDCKLYNIGFNKDKFEQHSSILQFRWSEADAICRHIQKVFHQTKEYVDNARKDKQPGKKMFVKIPPSMQQYLEIYATDKMLEFRFVAK